MIMKLLIIVLMIVSRCDAARFDLWTGCAIYRYITNPSECNAKCASARGTDVATCTYISYETCIKNGPGPTIINCKCQCINDCDFKAEIITKKPSECGVNKLQKVDEEIAKQIAFNVAGAVAGGIPTVGPLFDVVWGVWNPQSPVTSSFALANSIRDEVNIVITQLKTCMDNAISAQKFEFYKGKMDGLENAFQTTKGASGTERINHLFTTFSSFNHELTSIFTGEEKNYLEYENMLSIYQVLHPMYATVATERLLYLKYTKGDRNYKNEYSAVMKIFNKLDTWITWARSSINSHLTQKITAAYCKNEATMQIELGYWITNFDEKYIQTQRTNKQSIVNINSDGSEFKWKPTGKYIKLALGVNGCPSGSAIITAHECRLAMEDLGLKIEKNWESSTDTIPTGCSWRSLDNYFHFNNAATGQGRNDMFPICIAKPSQRTSAQYIKLDIGTSGCPLGQKIETKIICRYALSDLELISDAPWVGSTSGIPSGCSWRDANDANFHWNSDAPGKGRGDMYPICKAKPVPSQKYIVLDIGSNGCPKGQEIQESYECRLAMDDLGLKRDSEWIGTTIDIPTGCSWRDYNIHNFHFNSAVTGKGRGDLYPVCKATSTRRLIELANINM